MSRPSDATAAEPREDAEATADGTAVVERDDAVEAAAGRIEARADEIRREELDRALRRLDAVENIDDADRAAVRACARRLTDRLVSVPVSSLRATSDPETAGVALSLFGDETATERRVEDG